jgi:two-component system cell cycle response regulator DivK
MKTSKILIVEDNFDNSQLVQLLLEREKFEVFAAVNGKEGLEVARREHPDLIVLDLDMPVLSGWDMLKQLKDDPAIRDTRVVVVTAHLLPGERDKAVATGAEGYVSKPFTVHELISEIKGCLEQ